MPQQPHIQTNSYINKLRSIQSLKKGKQGCYWRCSFWSPLRACGWSVWHLLDYVMCSCFCICLHDGWAFEVRYQLNSNRQNSNILLFIKCLFGHDLGFVQLLRYRVYRVDESYCVCLASRCVFCICSIHVAQHSTILFFPLELSWFNDYIGTNCPLPFSLCRTGLL